MNSILVVDTNLTVYEQQTAEWMKLGIGTLRVDTMNEAITRLIQGESYLFIAINEDSVPSFWETLHLLRDVTDIPIYIITSSYTVAKHTKAVQCGADAYGSFAESTNGDILAGVTLLKQQNIKRKTKSLSILVGGDIIISIPRRIVRVNDTEISLQKKEFEILCLLIANKGQFLTRETLICKVWGCDYSESCNKSLLKTVSRLRTKLSVVTDKEYILVEREVGYKFLE